ncbi:Nuclear RNA export factor 1 [Cricetulus griseus]|nr:Nuclear RNA export factor 1 [Cricetulus griseus]
MWIINLLQSHCSVAFTPVDFQYIRNRIQFFVQNAQSAFELMNINFQIRDEENRKISICVCSSTGPASVQYKLTPGQMEILKRSMMKRYDVSRKSLSLKKLRFDPDLMDHGLDIFLNRRSCMAAMLQIIQVDFPELRTAWELEKMKGLKLKELWLEGNPMCSTFADNSAYVRSSLKILRKRREAGRGGSPGPWVPNVAPCDQCSVGGSYPGMGGRKGEENKRESQGQMEEMLLRLELSVTSCGFWFSNSAVLNCFPELLCLDGFKLFPTVDTYTLAIIKPRQETYRGSESLKDLIVQFMLQYYLIYDYGDRRNLLTAYHAEACFSLTITSNSDKPNMRTLEEYFKDSRNMKKIKDSFLRMQLLKHKKCNIVTCLHELPKTQHDLTSCVVDICAQTEKMICFSVNGVFKEMEGTSKGCIRAFTRTFILTAGRHFRLCIVNDEMILRNATAQETKKAFSTTMPTIVYAKGHQQMKDFPTWTDLT